MAKKKLTVFQKLNNIFGPTGVQSSVAQSNKYSIDNDTIFKTTDKAEYDVAKLQAQQNKYVGGMWRKVDNEMFQKTIHYETTRIGSYSDFENMEFYPEIAATLDIMREESTTVNDKGRVLNIYSNSKRVKTILEDLFFNRLDIHTSLPMWTRNTCKYGDNFVFLNIDDKAGIMGARQLPNFEIERREGDVFGRVMSTSEIADGKDSKVKFVWRGKDYEFNSWQVAHFRLLGDDRRLPYGTSVLEKARRIWKQLILSEDAMLIYRVTRAPERRVYKIFVGNIDDEDVPSYVDEIANRFKRTPITDPKTGQVDLQYNQMANDQDFFIPVRSEDAPNPIDTLPGASNLDQIADIEYLQRKLFTALRVPKSFLGFEDAFGDGKNLALQDIRFTRTINLIQQSMIMELNKIAILHLFLLGLEDELDNFTLTLNNPSTQAQMLKIEQMQSKITLYKDATTDSGNGFGVMSMTRGKREILEWSDEEIKQDFLEQRVEKAAAAEMENTANVIKHTGTFDEVDRLYGDIDAAKSGGSSESSDDSGGGDEGGFGGGGGGFGGGGLDFGDEGDDEVDFGGDEAGEAEGGEDEGGDDLDFGDEGGTEEPEATEESIKKIDNLLTENKLKHKKKLKKYSDNYFDKLLSSLKDSNDDTLINERVKVSDKNIRVNKTINDMIGDIDKIINE